MRMHFEWVNRFANNESESNRYWVQLITRYEQLYGTYFEKREDLFLSKKWNHTINAGKSRKAEKKDENVHECQFVDKNVLS